VASAIYVQSVGKQYRLGRRLDRNATLRDTIAERGRSAARLARGRRDPHPEEALLWALRDVSFDVAEGDVLGIIGRNGAGKSTLLKILSRITEPTEGRAEIHGRVGSLLEVGTGFHGELTGRENVYLNGAILGMRKTEIDRRFDEIVEFAEVSRFLDTPVKRYSSGMTVRLAFAVAAHLEPEILLVDEVLAVGDLAFQKKCIGKMGDVAGEGRTILFVSHNMAIMQALCRRGIFLQDGAVVTDASIHDAVGSYLRTLDAAVSSDLRERRDRRGWQALRLARVEVVGEDPGSVPATGRPARFTFETEGEAAASTCAFTIFNHLGHPVTTLTSADNAPGDVRGDGEAGRFVCELDALPLVPGRYRLDVELRGSAHLQDAIEAAAMFDVEEGTLDGRPVTARPGLGDVALAHRWRGPA
jgi:homopolymeric O-antigen transport system ATP-binding protein